MFCRISRRRVVMKATSCTKRTLCDNDTCETCVSRSFASNEKSVHWNYEMNENVTPRQVFLNSHKKYFFHCEVCAHDFDVRLANITQLGIWCAFCASKQLCSNDDCPTCFEKSFASSPKAPFWNTERNGSVTPRQVFPNTRSKFWFTCGVCAHVFQTCLHCIIYQNSWCPFCSNHKICTDTECMSCFAKSFSSHPKSVFWHETKNDSLTPRNVFLNCNRKIWFKCQKGHEFQSRLYHVTRGRWCPSCVHKTEQKLYEMLVNDFPSVKREFKPKWSHNRRYDFVIPDFDVIIELDGPQHFEQVGSWTPPETQRAIDTSKSINAVRNGYRIIRVLQFDVFHDMYDWYSELFEHITRTTNDPVVYMCKNNEYDQHYDLFH